MVALHTLHAYKARVLGIERKSCFPMSLTSSSSSSSRDKNKYGGMVHAANKEIYCTVSIFRYLFL